MLIDSDILIDAGRKEQKSVAFLDAQALKGHARISVVSQMELIVGCRDRRELDILEKFLARFSILNLTDEISQKAVELLRRYRLSHALLIPDALIAATAISHDLPLVTRNRRDFGFIQGLELSEY